MGSKARGRKKLSLGDVITSKTCRYVLLQELESLYNGCIYEVASKSRMETRLAMKIEWKVEGQRHTRLGMEIAALRLIRQKTVSPHFVDFIDQGVNDSFYFMVSTPVDESLDRLTEDTNMRFAPRTAFAVGVQMVDALRDLHSVGFIHRDIRPYNFCPGVDGRSSILYLVNLGRSVSYKKEDGTLRKPRTKAPIRGKLKFISLSTHSFAEQSPRDDIESLIYSMVDLCNGLSWRYLTPDGMAAQKKRLREFPDVCFRRLSPPTMKAILTYLDGLDYYKSVDYDYVKKMFTEAAKLEKIEFLSGKYEWEFDPDHDYSDNQPHTFQDSPPISADDSDYPLY
ncbi:hypothetical protein QR680_006407 [Steinernema hermaphroditum]|uniref:Protein kinase domain-containing protein n=1 Tax=Steinernema hermaphroditum TaxID=289476 RepID=A0AA39HWS5_9BILA|nr:hypothetical protein QR680_006407 [Steinernema hermaphroditum]